MINQQEKLLKIFREVSNIDDITVLTHLESMNLDSLEMLDVMAKINKYFKIEITIDDFVQSKNIMSLLEKINAKD